MHVMTQEVNIQLNVKWSQLVKHFMFNRGGNDRINQYLFSNKTDKDMKPERFTTDTALNWVFLSNGAQYQV